MHTTAMLQIVADRLRLHTSALLTHSATARTPPASDSSAPSRRVAQPGILDRLQRGVLGLPLRADLFVTHPGTPRSSSGSSHLCMSLPDVWMLNRPDVTTGRPPRTPL